MPSARWPARAGGGGRWSCCPVHTLPPSGEDPGPANDRGMVWPPQKPPLASRRRGNWHRRPREQEMSGRSPCEAGSCSVSSALSGNRLPNYGAVPAALSICWACWAPSPGSSQRLQAWGICCPFQKAQGSCPERGLPCCSPVQVCGCRCSHQPGLACRGATARSRPRSQALSPPKVTVQAEPCPGLPVLSIPSGDMR